MSRVLSGYGQPSVQSPDTEASGFRLLGIDPGLGTTGFGLISILSRQIATAESWGVMQTTPRGALPERLRQLYQDVQDLLAHTKPDAVAMESLFFFRNVTTAIPVAQARGVLVLAVAQAGLPLWEYTPMQVKQALTGFGKASKAEMAQAVMERLKLNQRPTPDDAIDGLAIALTGFQFQAVNFALG
jgi:crossover junction endodeoxyribonuclease RuvC